MRFNLRLPMLSPTSLQPQVDETTNKQVAVGDVILLCLAGSYKDDVSLTDMQALARYKLKIKVINCLNDVGLVDFSDEERGIIKGCAKKGLTVDAFGQVHEFLDTPILASPDLKMAS